MALELVIDKDAQETAVTSGGGTYEHFPMFIRVPDENENPIEIDIRTLEPNLDQEDISQNGAETAIFIRDNGIETSVLNTLNQTPYRERIIQAVTFGMPSAIQDCKHLAQYVAGIIPQSLFCMSSKEWEFTRSEWAQLEDHDFFAMTPDDTPNADEEDSHVGMPVGDITISKLSLNQLDHIMAIAPTQLENIYQKKILWSVTPRPSVQKRVNNLVFPEVVAYQSMMAKFDKITELTKDELMNLKLELDTYLSAGYNPLPNPLDEYI